MGQQEVSTSDNTTIKVTQLPKLASDGENWLTYHERVLNAATARGLRRHLSTTDTVPLLDEAFEKLETSIDSWDQKEAQVRELIYNTVDNATFLQIKGEKDSAALWTKLGSIHGNKGPQFEEYLSNMNTLRERLAEIGSPYATNPF